MNQRRFLGRCLFSKMTISVNAGIWDNFVFDLPGRMIMEDPCQWDKTSYLPGYIWRLYLFTKSDNHSSCIMVPPGSLRNPYPPNMAHLCMFNPLALHMVKSKPYALKRLNRHPGLTLILVGLKGKLAKT